MTYTSEIADAIGEVISQDTVTVTKSGGVSFSARRNRGEESRSEMRDAGYMPDAELLLMATADALSTAASGSAYAPAVNDEITVSGTVYVVLAVRTDSAFTHIRGRKEK
jgi:hypothetical protein